MQRTDITLIIFEIAVIVLALNVENIFADDGTTAASKNPPKPDQFENIPPPPMITYGPIVFEGVDYDDMPENYIEAYHDCYFDHLRCIRFAPTLYVVCAFHLQHEWVDVKYHCQVDLTNCLHRLYHKRGLYGTDNRNDVTFYNGDGKGCKET